MINSKVYQIGNKILKSTGIKIISKNEQSESDDIFKYINLKATNFSLVLTSKELLDNFFQPKNIILVFDILFQFINCISYFSISELTEIRNNFQLIYQQDYEIFKKIFETDIIDENLNFFVKFIDLWLINIDIEYKKDDSLLDFFILDSIDNNLPVQELLVITYYTYHQLINELSIYIKYKQ